MTVRAYAANSPKGRLEPFEYEPGPLGLDEVEVKVSHCGVCHSDLAMIDNDWGWSQYPIVPGHEVIGTIVGHHGGWADSVRCHWKFAVPIPDGLDPADAGPLMCAGTTVFTPMYQYGVRPHMRAAVLGIGGLGHLAVQFLSKMGCEVTAISSSHDKDDQARKMGATRFLATKGTDELKKAAGSFDFILSTVSADVPWGDYVAALKPGGRLVICGLPESDIRFSVVPLLAERSVSGGMSGSPSDTKVMFDFCVRHGVKPYTEVFAMKDINQAVDHVRAGKARFRAVLAA
jgi:uncharacterized zinc-type alcohol dehydrogenase-like protein